MIRVILISRQNDREKDKIIGHDTIIDKVIASNLQNNDWENIIIHKAQQ